MRQGAQTEELGPAPAAQRDPAPSLAKLLDRSATAVASMPPRRGARASALAEIVSQSGRQFDPACVEALRAVV